MVVTPDDATGEGIDDATGEGIDDATGEGIDDATGEDIDEPIELDPDAAREHLLDTYSDLLRTTLDCADAVAAGFETTVDGHPATEDAQAIRTPLRAALERAGALERYPGMLADAVAAAGGSMAAPPVAGPPYVAVSSSGPVLRATQGERRLVVQVEAFEVRDSAFVRTAREPERALQICLKE